MTRKLLSCCLWLCPLVFALASEPKPRPDIVVFLTDDQSQSDLAPYGSRTFKTPNMQRLADAGLTFTDAYVASPTCAPSRAALLTGLMPARNGAEPNHAKPRPEIRKWPAYFQEIGYEVVAFGKVSHYKHTVDYGFDYFAHDTFHDHAAIPAAVAYLKNRPRKGAKPLCLMVGSNWPHVPWPESSEGYSADAMTLPARSVDTPATRAWRAHYAAAVNKADDDLGMILDAAHSYLGADTIYLFSSDNGAQWPFAKWTCYEAGVRVPLIVVWPDVIKPGTRTAALVSWVDFLPTLLEAAGGKPPEQIDGRSFLAVLQGRTSAHRDRIFTTHSGDGRFNVYPIRAVRSGRWKYIRNLHPEFAFTTHIDLPVPLGQRDYFKTWEAAALTNQAARSIVTDYHYRPAEELFDLAADPDEKHNLAGKSGHQEELKRLRTELNEWMRRQGDQEKVYAEPRLLSDPTSYGPGAVPDGGAQGDRQKKKQAVGNKKQVGE
jgi:arylsulfatase A-like enzyme